MRDHSDVQIRNALPEEFDRIGQLLVAVYSQIDGFPKEADQPKYYELLRDVGRFTLNKGTEIIVAVASENEILGSVVNFSEMKYYGSGGIAPQEQKAGAFRLLAVSPSSRGKGIGRLLTLECIARAKNRSLTQVIIHTTTAMMPAWHMYEKIGFRRSEDLDFMQGDLPVLGFRLSLS